MMWSLSPQPRPSRPGHAVRRTRRRSPCLPWTSWRRRRSSGRPWLEGPRRPSKPWRRRRRATSAEAVLKQPLRLMTLRRPAGAARTAPPGHSLKLRPVRATRLAPPGQLQKESGGGAQEHPTDHVEVETLVLKPPRAEVEGIAEEETVQEAPVVEGATVPGPAEARDESTVAVVPVPTAQGGVTAVVELPDSSEEYGDSMDIDPAAAASAATHMSEGRHHGVPP